MTTYYDGLNDFHKLIETKRPSASAQLLGFHLLHLNNRNGNSGSFQVSDRELENRTRLSKQSITDAKRYLKNVGWLEFKTDRHKVTTYSLLSFKVGQAIGQVIGQQAGHSSRLSPRLKSAEEEQRQRDAQEAAVGESVTASSNVTAGAKPLSSPDANDIQEVWSRAIGYALRGNRALELEQLASPDYDRALKAIERTSKRDDLTDEFAYFKAVYDGLKPTKGGVINGEHRDYAEPAECDGIDWRDSLAELKRAIGKREIDGDATGNGDG